MMLLAHRQPFSTLITRYYQGEIGSEEYLRGLSGDVFCAQPSMLRNARGICRRLIIAARRDPEPKWQRFYLNSFRSAWCQYRQLMRDWKLGKLA